MLAWRRLHPRLGGTVELDAGFEHSLFVRTRAGMEQYCSKDYVQHSRTSVLCAGACQPTVPCHQRMAQLAQRIGFDSRRTGQVRDFLNVPLCHQETGWTGAIRNRLVHRAVQLLYKRSQKRLKTAQNALVHSLSHNNIRKTGSIRNRQVSGSSPLVGSMLICYPSFSSLIYSHELSSFAR